MGMFYGLTPRSALQKQKDKLPVRKQLSIDPLLVKPKKITGRVGEEPGQSVKGEKGI
jgi:hypothetical protein